MVTSAICRFFITTLLTESFSLIGYQLRASGGQESCPLDTTIAGDGVEADLA
jgi:hypothetical protein